MSEKYEAKVLVVGGGDPKSSAPPLKPRHKLKKFHSHLQTPFDVESEEEIKDYLNDQFGPGYYRVYSPAYYERMKTWFKGWVAKSQYKKQNNDRE